MKLQSTDFELFGLPTRFAQDRAEIDQRWKSLQKQAHPDRFAADGAAAQRLAMQWSVRINEAYQRLKDPIKRASYLCELSGAPIRAHDNTSMPADFLMQQMDWRESLEEADSACALESLLQDTSAAHSAALAELEQLLDVQLDPAAAAQVVRRLMFVERFAHEVEERLDHISA
jgi:molecular chaperone HscB